jgi:hypothetical protein
MDRRYQVFVSSTYEDLHEERREVMQALLNLDCIPTGMELFPAADDDSWTHIQRFIAGCDYYVVIVGGRYGSTGPAGKSYTEMEYDFAVEAGLPSLAFLHKDPGTIPASKTEPTDEGKAALTAFRKKIESARHAKYWTAPGELAGTVTLGMASIMKIKPRVGWVRADLLAAGEDMRDELLRLRREIDSLNGELIVAKNRAAPEGVEDLAQGAETTNITIEFESPDVFSLDVRWDSLMRAVLPQTFGGGAPPEAIGSAVASLVQREAAETRRSEAEFLSWHRSIVSRSDYGKVLNQMVALGLVEGRVDPTNPLATRWFATPYGIQTGSRLLAVRRAPDV